MDTCPVPSSPTPDELAARGNRAYAERGIDGLAATWDPDVVYEEDPLWPGSATFRGRAAVVARFREYEEQLGAGTATLEEVIRAADAFVVIWRHAGATSAAGVPFEHRWAWVTRVRDGQITHIRAYFDPEEGLRAVGVTHRSPPAR